MARYSRVRGPAVNFLVNTALVLVPGISVSRQFGQGSLIIAGHCQFGNDGVGDVDFGIRVFLDGVAVGVNDLRITVEKLEVGTVSWFFFEAINPGVHSIEVRAIGDVEPDKFVVAGGVELVVIELPEWDSDGDLVTL